MIIKNLKEKTKEKYNLVTENQMKKALDQATLFCTSYSDIFSDSYSNIEDLERPYFNAMFRQMKENNSFLLENFQGMFLDYIDVLLKDKQEYQEKYQLFHDALIKKSSNNYLCMDKGQIIENMNEYDLNHYITSYSKEELQNLLEKEGYL